MKQEKVIEVVECGDEDGITVQPQKSVIPIDKNINEIESNTLAMIKTEKVNEGMVNEYELNTETETSKQPPTSVQVDPSISNNSNSQSAQRDQRFGECFFTFKPSNQTPTASVVGLNQNAGQHINDVDMDHESFSNSITQNVNNVPASKQTQALNTSLLASNEPCVNSKDIIGSVMNDHQYAKSYTSTDNLAILNDKLNEENSKQELVGDVTVKIEPIDNVEPTVKTAQPQYKYFPEIIDLISDQEDVASNNMCNGQSDDDDDHIQPTYRRQQVYNTRAGGHFKAGRWQKLVNQSTVCDDKECNMCMDYSKANKKPHKCSTCGKRFVRKYDLGRHMKGHENQFRCLICHIGLSDAKSCRSHKYHCKFTRFECHLCKKDFGNIRKLIKHSKRIHIGKRIRQFSCPSWLPNSKFHLNLSKFEF